LIYFIKSGKFNYISIALLVLSMSSINTQALIYKQLCNANNQIFEIYNKLNNINNAIIANKLSINTTDVSAFVNANPKILTDSLIYANSAKIAKDQTKNTEILRFMNDYACLMMPFRLTTPATNLLNSLKKYNVISFENNP
jgi:CO dehydrogenase nickel-insertion accessory protein CooC1